MPPRDLNTLNVSKGCTSNSLLAIVIISLINSIEDTCTHMFIAALFTIAKTYKQPKCPSTDDWIRKMWYRYTREYYSGIKKNKTMLFAATWMELETLILSEVRKRKTNTTWYHLYMESKIWNKWIYLQNRNKLMDMENRVVVTKGEGEGVGWTESLGLVDANYCIWSDKQWDPAV